MIKMSWVVVVGLSLGVAQPLWAESIDLTIKGFKHITFDDIPETKYTNSKDTLSMEVKQSSSLLLIPFDKIKTLQQVNFEWQFSGEWKLKTAKEERSKDGDDSKLRVGLVIAGEAPWVPFIAPAWIKAVQKVMKLETDQLLYLQPGAMHKAGQKWESPYSDSILNIAVKSNPSKGGWMQVTHRLEKPLKVVGLWLMADGDNTKVSFTTKLRKLSLE